MNARIVALLSPGIRSSIEQEKDALRVDTALKEAFGGEKPSKQQLKKLLGIAEFHLSTMVLK